MYYTINEETARRAREMNSYREYIAGSATENYKGAVNLAAEIAERQKQKVDPIYHDKIDYLLDLYARKLADNTNRMNAVDASYPSILVAGGSGISVSKKEKQNARRDSCMKEYNEIQSILDKIKSTGTGGIMSDDKRAIEKLKIKLEQLERAQETMKAVNAYYRKYKTLDGCTDLSPRAIEEIKADMARSWRTEPKPFESYSLTNNNANIKRTRERIAELEKEQQRAESGAAKDITGNGYTLTENADLMRIQFIFDDKPDESTRTLLKSNGFKWAPSQGAWQRMLNNNGRYAAKRVMQALSA